MYTRSQWHQIEVSAKGSIQERKIRVSYLPAEYMETTPIRHTNGIVRTVYLSASNDEGLLADFTSAR